MRTADITPGKKYIYKFRNMISYRTDYVEVRVLAVGVPVMSYPANPYEKSKLSHNGVLTVATGAGPSLHSRKGDCQIVQPNNIIEAVPSRAIKLPNTPERVVTNGREYEILYRVEKRKTVWDDKTDGYRTKWVDAGGPVRDFRLPTREMAEKFIAGRHDLSEDTTRIVPVKVRVKASGRSLVNA